ncbi:beta-lactamase class A [Fictibacillus solisalsi]|uniref:Beta-lactamase class A n=1 Tax=Fictibacillus solisalsi TaxID=459525 RepID=A0A1H0AB32_9BACL|nr:serine hydrolase [Fictibacillus solisalsi]SDN30780.1 beta-lactamase class A [Fictibacillus solisalsi]
MTLNELKNRLNGIIDPLTGEFAYYIETEEGYIGENEEKVFPAASLIKLPILIEAFRQKEAGLLDLSLPVPIKPKDKVGGAGIINHLSPDASLTVLDVLTLMITVSDNTGANVMIEQAGRERINALLTALRCHRTVLKRKLMDFKAIQEGKNNYTSAKDVVLLLKEIHHGKLMKNESRVMMLDILRNQQFRHKLPGSMDEEVVMIANKTGELQGTEHDAGIFEYKDTTVIAAVLTKNLSNEAEARHKLAAIGTAIQEYLMSVQKN